MRFRTHCARLVSSLLPTTISARPLGHESSRRFGLPLRFRPWLPLLAVGLLFIPMAQAVQTNTFTTLAITPNESVSQGTVLTLQASVSDGEGPVMLGTVTFYDASSVLGEVAVVRTESTYAVGTGNLKLRLGVGSHDIKAVYSGGGGFKSSTSTTHTVMVAAESAAATTTTITSSGPAGNYTLIGKVTSYSSTAPTGTVTFKDQTNSDATVGSASLDPETLTSGWQTLTSYATAAGSYGIVIGDLNADGFPDIVTSNYNGTSISVLLANGDGTYQTQTEYTAPAGVFGLALGDLNGDGFPDIVAGQHYSASIGVYLANGDGTFQARQQYSSESSSQYVAVGDMNNDGKLDVVSLSSDQNKAIVLLGNGDGTLQALTSYNVGGYPYGLTVGDFNNDGNLDVAVANNETNSIGVLLGNGDGTLQAQVAYASSAGPTGVITADLDGDGNLDLISNLVDVFLGNGDGTFEAKVTYSAANCWGLTSADVNGDGIRDIVCASLASRVYVLEGNGDGTLKTAVATSTGTSNYEVAVGDLNGDGIADLAVPDLNPTSPKVKVSLGSISETATVTGINIQGQGTHQVFASYEGDESSAQSESTTIDLEGSQISTTVTLSAAPSPTTVGQTVTLTAAVAPAAQDWVTANGLNLTGTVTFYDGETQIGDTVTLVGGEASMTKNDFTAGSHSLTAIYSGDTDFAGSTSQATTLQVNKKTQTITFAAMNPVTYGVAPLTLTATASSELTVTFSKVSGPGIVEGNSLTVTGAGSIVIQADQAGDDTYQAAEPVQRTLTVNKASTTSVVVSSDLNVDLNTSVTFTATVDSAVSAVPTGTYSFYDGETKLADVELDEAGVASYSTSALTAGTHSITAVYGGNANYLASTSAAISQVVVGPDYSIAASPSTITIKTGQSGTSTLTFTPVGGYSGDVTLSCSGLPAHAACTFVPSSINMSGDNAIKTTILTVTTTDQVAAMHGWPLTLSGSMRALALLTPLGLFGLPGVRRGRRRLQHAALTFLGIALVGIGLLGITSCGSAAAGPPTSPPGTSHVTVTATASGVGGTNHTATVTITITQ